MTPGDAPPEKPMAFIGFYWLLLAFIGFRPLGGSAPFDASVGKNKYGT
jgi:hypothetical protein